MSLADLLAETRQSLNELASEQKVALSTTWRWSLRGIGGVRLETFSVGGRKFTTREAFQRFIARTNGQRVTGDTPRQRERSINRAEKKAAALGI